MLESGDIQRFVEGGGNFHRIAVVSVSQINIEFNT